MKPILCIIPILLLVNQLFAQNNPQISGSLETNANFFIRDSTIGAANTPQYDRQLYGGEAWLNLAYSNWGFDFILRFDLFNNSNLLNPTGSYSDEGIGRWFINKKINKLGISAGYIYDQIGSGIIFRAYEERPLLIDNALYGLRLSYDLAPDWQIKAFTGRQKQQFDTYNSIIKGLNIEGFLTLGDSTGGVALAPGFGILNRTLDDNSMNSLVATLNTYPKDDIFEPKYNAYAFSLYNTLTAGPVSWYLEAAYKTKDPINTGIIIQEPGSVLYSSISYAKSGLGITLEAKRTENFTFRTRPQAQANQGFVNFLPPMARVNTYRLPSRYNAATQELGELAFQADIRYLYNKDWTFNINVSNITNLDDELLYREIYTEIGYKYKREWSILGGVQFQNYNQEVYEFKPGVPNVQTVTPFAEFLYKFDRTKALRIEAQAMFTGEDKSVELRQDYGSWLFGLAEFSIAPHWTFTASDMYNVKAGRNSPVNENGEKLNIHYPRFDIYYTYRSNRFSLSYVKQVEGVVCAGGICRLEPAFSGVKMTVNSTF
ncbi:MAG: DUF6029 family protein [Saprospiraceae bacterium]|nr:DUF6029 family protein [Saprospiraceae bacterium]